MRVHSNARTRPAAMRRAAADPAGPAVAPPDAPPGRDSRAARDSRRSGAARPARPARSDGPGRAEVPDRQTRQAVERVLEASLRQRLAEARAVDDVFGTEMADRVAEFALRGGRRLRAAFAWWGWRAAGGAAEGEQAHGALHMAAALELIQTCALIHDDVMDGSPLRRGLPAVQVDFAAQHERSGVPGDSGEFGRSAAILAGDLALAWADDLAVDAAIGSGVWRRIRGTWRSMRTEMVAGQYLDLRAQAAADTPDAALRIAYLKSALYTVERPLELGARMAGAGPGTERALRSAARSAGLAFQLRDDLRGVFGDPRRTGKPSGEDVRQGKFTYLVALAHRSAEATGNAAMTDLLARSVGEAGLSAVRLNLFREAVRETGAVDAVEAKIEELTGESLRQLRAAAVEPAAERRLTELFLAAGGHGHTAGRSAGHAAGHAAEPTARHEGGSVA